MLAQVLRVYLGYMEQMIRVADKAAQIPKNIRGQSLSFEDEPCEDFKVLNREEAQALLARMPQTTLRSMLWVQALVGFVVIALASFWSGYEGVMRSVVAGVLCALVPSAIFVWQMGAGKVSRFSPQLSLMWFFVWEAVKVFCSVALLVIAVLWIDPLVWQALLVGFVVTVKAYGVGCWLSLSSNKQVKSS